MAEYSLLRNAPITEALIDIRTRIKADFDVDRFLALHDAISARYPEKKTRHKWEGRFDFKPGAISTSAGAETIDGYLFKSSDGKQIVQARVDGFTFNRLKPYETWESFRDEALGLWKLYRDLISPEITRVALRFINKIDIPLSSEVVLDFDDYLAAGPVVPKGLPQGLSSFLTRIVINEPVLDAAAIVTQAFEGAVEAKVVPIILDIDVFRQKEQISDDDAWNALEELRHFKNRIFFESITEKAKELFK